LQDRRRGGKDAFDSRFLRNNGIEVSVNVSASPIVNGEGEYVGNLALVRDSTEREELHSQLMVSDRMASVGALAAGVAHEINNPLAAVIANLEYVRENLGLSGALGEITEALADAVEAAERMRFIVRDLKIFSRSPTGDKTGPSDVKAIMESSLRMAWNEIRHRAALVKDYGDVPEVEGNEARLGQLFLNLIVNAAQAMPEGRAEHNEIRVSTRVEGERVIVEVSDTGIGIPPDVLPRVFDAFFTTKGVGVGTGLGLAISQRIVTDMRGELTVRSEVGKGTTFRAALPIARKHEPRAVAPVTPVTAAGRPGRILVVDDEKLVARGVSRVLSGEHEVVEAVTAKDALERCLGAEPFDVILCDLMMPDMTGMDLHAELVRVAPDQAERMVFMTGGAFTANARKFLAETPREQVEKPFNPADLRAIVRRYLR
jgi:signal transduction histidine kinase